MKAIVYLFLGGGLGCVGRYLIGKLVLKWYDGSFPFGTLLVNLLSCVIVALLLYTYAAKLESNKVLYLLLITGFCGGLSTFSTFSLENFELLKQGFYQYAILNIVISILLSLGIFYFLYSKSAV